MPQGQSLGRGLASRLSSSHAPGTVPRAWLLEPCRLRARVGAVVDLAEALAVDVAVDLRRRERRVAEQLLDRAQVGAALEQVRRERVPQPVRMRRDPSQRARVEAAAAHREEERVLGARCELRAARARGSARATSPPPRRAGRRAPCRPCRARARAPARSRRRRGRGRPPPRCAARPSRRARRALGSATRAARRLRARRASRRSRRSRGGSGRRRDRLGRERDVGNARRTERGAQERAHGGEPARDARGCEARASAAELRGVLGQLAHADVVEPKLPRVEPAARSARGRRGTTGASRRRTLALPRKRSISREAPQAVIRAGAHSSSRSSDHITKSTRLSRRAL